MWVLNMMTKLLHTALLRWSVFLSVVIVVSYALFRPEPPVMIFEHSDKMGHIIAFMTLALTGRLAFIRFSKLGFWLTMSVLAFMLEYLQGEFRPLRIFSLDDAYANLLGVVVALVVFEVGSTKTKIESFLDNSTDFKR